MKDAETEKGAEGGKTYKKEEKDLPVIITTWHLPAVL